MNSTTKTCHKLFDDDHGTKKFLAGAASTTNLASIPASATDIKLNAAPSAGSLLAETGALASAATFSIVLASSKVTGTHTYTFTSTSTDTASKPGTKVGKAANIGKNVIDSLTNTSATKRAMYINGFTARNAGGTADTPKCKAVDATGATYAATVVNEQKPASTFNSSVYTAALPKDETVITAATGTLSTSVIGDATTNTGLVTFAFSLTTKAKLATSGDDVEAFSCVNLNTAQWLCGYLKIAKSAAAKFKATESLYASGIAPAATHFSATIALSGGTGFGFVPSSGD